MKKLNILLIALLAIVLGGCTDKTTEHHFVDSNVGVIEKFEFEGHTYLIRNGYYRSGLCHDENCKCKSDSIR